jgi:Lhr-like helicase
MQLVLHSPFGARINRAWGLALRKRFCRSFNFELQAAATDNGIVISLSDQHSFPLELVFKFLSKETVEEVLTQAMLPAPMFEVRWRWDTSRALAVLRFAGGRKCRRRSSACAPTICSPRCFPIKRLVRKTSSATSAFPITRSSTRRSRTACTRRWISTA